MVLVAMGLVLAACGGSDEGTGPTDDGSATSVVSDVDHDGVLRVGYELVASASGGFTLDPAKAFTSATDDGLFYLIYGRLMAPTQSGTVEPSLAEAVTVIDPGTIEIVLRDGLTFQDGVAFDATAVKAGLERSLAANNRGSFSERFFDLQAITVVDPTTLRLSIANGTAASWHDSFLGSWQTSIVRDDTDFDRPVGAGPMRVTEFMPEQRLELERWDGYWDPDAVAVGGMELTQVSVSEPQVGIAALRAGQIDFVQSNITQLDALSGDLEALKTPDANRVYNLPLCKKDGPLADARVRMALNKAIDRQAINDALFAGSFVEANQLWPEGNRFYVPELADQWVYDPDTARQLLQEAGYGDGFSFDVYVLTTANMPETVEIVQQQLAEVGVDITIIPSPNYVQDFLTPQKPGAGGTTATQPGPARLSSWTGDGLGNTCHYVDPELARLQQELYTVSSSSDEAVELWQEANEIVVDDALSVFILYGASVAAYDGAHVGEPVKWPLSTIMFPDVRETYVKAKG